MQLSVHFRPLKTNNLEDQLTRRAPDCPNRVDSLALTVRYCFRPALALQLPIDPFFGTPAKGESERTWRER